MKALAELRANEVNALVVFLGNFGPEGPETMLAEKFGGPVMFCAAAEENIKQQPPASPPRRRPTRVTIREPVGTPPAERSSAPQGKGKQKAAEPVIDLDESSDENGIVISLLDNLPIPCHLFDGDDNFTYTPNLGPDFFVPESECMTSRVNSVATSSNSSGIGLCNFLYLFSNVP